MVCPRCGTENPETSAFCYQCGGPLKETPGGGGQVVCSRCGRVASPGQAYCNNCGAPLAAVPPPAGVVSAPPRSSGLPAWAWVLMGCGALILIGLIVIFGCGLFFYKQFSEGPIPKEAQAQFNLKELRKAVDMFESDCGAYPRSLADLVTPQAPAEGLRVEGEAVVTAPIKPEDWSGPYYLMGGDVPVNPLTGGNQEGTDWTYETKDPSRLGHVGIGPAAKGTDLTGVPYTKW